ncbi:MAG: RidA family protein [Actinomycetia bacterium]|nr:RidA family protein [Actinomycetes bacterium]
MPIERINPAGLAPPVMGLYTHVTVATGTRHVEISGQVALDADGNLVGAGDHATQARQAFTNLRLALESVGGTGLDLVRYTISVVDHGPELIEPIFAAGAAVFADAWPQCSSMLVGVESLGLPDGLVENEGTAVLP